MSKPPLVEQIKEVETLFHDGKHNEARRQIEEILQQNPDCVEAHFWFGVTLLTLEERNRAIVEFTKVLVQRADHNNARCFRGEAYLGEFQFDDAYEDFREVISNNPTHGRAYDGMAKLFIAQGDWENAIAFLTDAIENTDDCPSVRLKERAECWSALGDRECAFDDLTEARRHAPDDLEIIRLRAELSSFLEKFDEELEDLNQLLEREPNNTRLIRRRTRVLIELNFFEDGLRDFEHLEALGVVFDKFDYVFRGIARRGCRDLQGAINDFSASIALDQLNKFGFLERGRSYLECKKWEESIKDLDNVCNIDKRDYGAFILRARSYGELGKMDEAIRDVSYVIENALHPEWQEELLDALQWRANFREAIGDSKGAKIDRATIDDVREHSQGKT